MNFVKPLITFVFTAVVLLTFSDCKKKKPSTEPEAPVNTYDESGQSISDLLFVQSEVDYAVTEIFKYAGDSYTLPGNALCGIRIDSSQKSTGKIRLNFDTTSACGGRTRKGFIQLSIGIDPNHSRNWPDTGCLIFAEYNYTVTRVSDQKSMQILCQQYLTNVSGGTFRQLLQNNVDSLVTGNNDPFVSATFSDGSTVVYNLVRRFTYTYANGLLSCRIQGAKSNCTYKDFAGVGQARDGRSISCRYVTPVLWNLSCGTPVLLQGKAQLYEVRSNVSFELDADLGVDASGNRGNLAPGACPYGWKLSWTADQAYSKVIAY